MKKVILFIVILWHSATILAQDKKPVTPPTIKAGTGVFIPVGNLQKYFSASPYFEFSVNAPFFLRNNFGFGLQFIVPNQKDALQYQTIDNTLTQVKISSIINLTFNFRKRFLQKKNTAFEFRLGAGFSGIQTNLRNPNYTGKKDENKYETISSFLVNPSIEYLKQFKDGTELSFGIGIQYAPYKIEGAVKENIGGVGCIPKLMYVF